MQLFSLPGVTLTAFSPSEYKLNKMIAARSEAGRTPAGTLKLPETNVCRVNVSIVKVNLWGRSTNL